ncbi:hypothetical protein HNS38_19980, partial [Lentimicrobium sp. L6]|uniref:hypothetical protein n=1 Tax=Lentimicrobium sp. L6 TaxID=2735916 RepID=UPI00155700C3
MKKYITLFIIIIVLIFSSCQDPEYSSTYNIRNKSNQMITIYFFNSKVESIESVVLNAGDIKKDTYGNRGGNMGVPPNFRADSLHVVFNDTVSITHFYKATSEDVNRNMFLSSSWISQLS